MFVAEAEALLCTESGCRSATRRLPLCTAAAGVAATVTGVATAAVLPARRNPTPARPPRAARAS
jgi:hypothetical protein